MVRLMTVVVVALLLLSLLVVLVVVVLVVLPNFNSSCSHSFSRQYANAPSGARPYLTLPLPRKNPLALFECNASDTYVLSMTHM